MDDKFLSLVLRGWEVDGYKEGAFKADDGFDADKIRSREAVGYRCAFFEYDGHTS